MTLTEKGHYLKKKIDAINKEISCIKAELARETIQKTLLVGASRTIGEYFIADKLQEFTLTETTAEIDLVIDNTSNLIQLLDQGKLDVAFISGPFDKSRYDTKIFLEDSIVAICSPENPIAKMNEVAFSDLESERLLLREKGAGIFGALEEALLDRSISLEQFSERTIIGNIYLIKELVKKNEGISFLYRISVTDDLAKETLIEIPLTDFSYAQPFYLVFNKNKTANKLRDKFVCLFEKEIKQEVKKSKE